MYKLFITIMFFVLINSFAFANFSKESLQSLKMDNLHLFKQDLAKKVATELQNKSFRNFLQSRITHKKSAHALLPLLKDYSETFSRKDLYTYSISLDLGIRQLKGIEKRLTNILEIHLVEPATSSYWQKPESVLIAYIPKGNEKSWESIEAFDSFGSTHKLAVNKAPKVPVLVVGLDAKKDMRAGLALLNDELKKAGLQTATPKNLAGLDVAKLNYIRLEDDKEPWISGDAEIYTLVNGISTEVDKANVLSMEMPYLDKDKKNYYPNQVLIVWQNYRYMAANLNIYEHDDNTNYKEIAAKLVEAIGKVVPKYQAIFDIAGQIIKLMPDSWWTNDDDYVDVFYTLEKGKSYKNYRGASRNATITLEPYVIPGSGK